MNRLLLISSILVAINLVICSHDKDGADLDLTSATYIINEDKGYRQNVLTFSAQFRVRDASLSIALENAKLLLKSFERITKQYCR